MKRMKQLSQPPNNIGEIGEILSGLGDYFRKQRTGKDSFQKYQLRFQTSGWEGLKDLAPLRKPRPRVTSKEVVERVINLSIERPGWGCIRLGRALKEQGISISPPTVQSILNKNNLRDKNERVLQLEERAVRESLTLSREQIEMIETINPCFRERERKSKRPGQLLAQDTFFIGDYDGIGKLYMQMVVDTYDNYVFGLLHTGKFSDYAVALLHNEVLPFYKKHGLRVERILTDNGREYCGTGQHHFELYLMLNDIEHERLPLRQTQTNGFLLHLHHKVWHEFILKNGSDGGRTEYAILETQYQQWLNEYNYHYARGYPNMGKSPSEMLGEYLKGNT